MAREQNKHIRPTLPDSKYNSTKVTKLINRVMMSGKKTVAQKQVYASFDILKAKLGRDPLEAFDQAIRNVSPIMEVRSRRVGGAAYQVPTPVKAPRAFALAVRWLIQEAAKRPNSSYHTFAEKLAAEMMDALKNEGGAMTKKNLMHKMAEANKAFAHFKW